MKKFYRSIVNHPKTVVIIFLVLAVVCGFLRQAIQVDYDITDYLPEGSPSTVALNTMKKEFTGGIPNARVMIKDVSIPKALEYKAKLKKIDGVTDVMWLDDSANMAVPVETMDKNVRDVYYKNNNALFVLTIDDNKRIDATSAIRNLIGSSNAASGSEVSTATATTSTLSEITRITIMAVLFVLLILVLTTTSWLEPLIIMAGLGVAILINAGTNLIFGKISFITNGAGDVLQLAVSLDYSVFLLHRFEDTHKKIPDVKEAMLDSMCKSTSSIASSGLTTVIGFLALVLMQFRLGPDLGLALAKGVGISLVSVFTFLPALLLLTYKGIDKTQHKPFVPSFKKFGKLITKVMLPCVCIFAAAILPSLLASNANDFYYGESHIFGMNTKLGVDTNEIEKAFDKNDTYVLLVPKGDTASEKKLSTALKKYPEVKDIISYVDKAGPEIPTAYLDNDTLSKLESKHYSRMVLSVKTDYEGSDTFRLIQNIRNTAHHYYPKEYYLAGNGISTYDLMNTITKDSVKVNAVAIGSIFIVLLFTMKSIFLPIALVLSIETAVWINMAFPYFSGKPIFYIAYLIISSIQLGATVDYAILFTNSYREFRQTLNKKQSVIQTVSTCTVSVITSGSVLTVVGFLLGFISTHGLLSQLGFMLGRGTLCSLIIVLFVLPGLLYIFDKLFIKNGKNTSIDTVPQRNKEVVRNENI